MHHIPAEVTSQILQQAQKLVLWGWTQDTSAKTWWGTRVAADSWWATQFCAFGAIDRASLKVFPHDDMKSYRWQARDAAVCMLCKEIEALGGYVSSDPIASIASWNDSGARLKSEVANAIERAAKRAAAEIPLAIDDEVAAIHGEEA